MLEIVCFMVVMEILLSLCFTASQEGEQCGDKLGPGGNLWLLQKPQHPLRTARCHCSRHWEGQSVTVGPPFFRPPSISPSPSQTHPVPPRFLPLIFASTSAPGEHNQVELLKKKKRNHYIFIRPAISTVCWAHNWWADFIFCKTFTFLIPYGCLAYLLSV